MDFISIFLILISLLNFGLGIFIYSRSGKSRANIYFGFFAIFVALWGVTIFGFRMAEQELIALGWMKAAYISAILIALSFWYFSFEFIKRVNVPIFITALNFLVAFFFSYIIATSGFLVQDLYFRFWGKGVILSPPGWYLFAAYFIFYFLSAHLILFRKYIVAYGIERIQLKFVVFSVFIAGEIFGVFFNLILPSPFLNNFRYIWLGPLFTAIIIVSITYAIIRHHLLNVKVIAAELLTAALAFVVIIELFLSKNRNEFLFRSVIVLLVFFFGYLLIRSVINEVKRREELQVLTDRLRQSNLLLAERNKFLTALQELTELITRTLDFKKAMQEIADGIASKLGYIGGFIVILSEDEERLELAALSQAPLTKKALKLLPVKPEKYVTDFKKSKTLGTMAVKTGKIQIGEQLEKFISPPVGKTTAQAIQKLIGIKLIIAVPIYAENKVIGSIEFLLDKPEKELKQTEIQMMKVLADQAGIVTRNLRYLQKIQDVNDKLAKANVELQKLDRAKSEFISIASHQLRTPLTIVKGYLSMIFEGMYGQVNSQVETTLKKVSESADRLISLVNDLLDISRIESGKIVFNIKPMSLANLAASVVEEFRLKAKEKDLKIIYKKPTGLPLIQGDEAKLRQVMMNLLDNSIKYTSQGKITVNVEKVEDWVEFSVKDSGMGIEKKDMALLFQKFSRGTGMSLVHTEGSGIGLFVGRKIIQAHQGRIWAESRGKGQGSRFVFRIRAIKNNKKTKK